MKEFVDWVGQGLNGIGLVSTILWVVTIAGGVYGWASGILPALIRLGNGFSKRKIAIFAIGPDLEFLKGLLEDSHLFKKNNIITISSQDQFRRANQATLYLVSWPDWSNLFGEILKIKSSKEGAALIVYAPQDKGPIPQETMRDLNRETNVSVANLRGRLLNDIIVYLITTDYK